MWERWLLFFPPFFQTTSFLWLKLCRCPWMSDLCPWGAGKQLSPVQRSGLAVHVLSRGLGERLIGFSYVATGLCIHPTVDSSTASLCVRPAVCPVSETPAGRGMLMFWCGSSFFWSAWFFFSIFLMETQFGQPHVLRELLMCCFSFSLSPSLEEQPGPWFRDLMIPGLWCSRWWGIGLWKLAPAFFQIQYMQTILLASYFFQLTLEREEKSNMSASCLCVSITQTSWSFLFVLEGWRNQKEFEKSGAVLGEQMTSCEENRKETRQRESEKKVWKKSETSVQETSVQPVIGRAQLPQLSPFI